MRVVLALCFSASCALCLPHRLRRETDVGPVDEAYTTPHWARVDFPPVPAFLIDTHDPISQDVFISGAAHNGSKPWDPFIWERILELSLRLPAGGKGARFVDVGANLGYFSLMAASLGFEVVAFEPMSRNARKLARSIERNSFGARITLYQNAVSDVHGARVLLHETDASNQGNGQIVASLNTKGDAVTTVTLDTMLYFQPHAPTGADIVKIDVEGFETNVLAGARAWLGSTKVRYVLIEFSEATRASKTASATEMFAFMRDAGYNVSDVAVGIDTPLNYAALVAGDFSRAPANLLFALD